jgi:hypothetical protein
VIDDLDDKQDVYEKLRAIMSEHFDNFCFIVMNERGDLYYDYTNFRVGRMLMSEAQNELKSEMEDCELMWFDDDDLDD